MAIKSSLVQSLALLLGTLNLTHGQDNSSSPGLPWVEADYQTSPEVLPQPDATGSGWNAAFSQAAAFVSQLTLEEKATLVTGTQGPCVGNIGSIPRLDFEGLCLQDGPLAIRVADYASVFPAGLTVAASWDRTLARIRGQDIGTEFKGALEQYSITELVTEIACRKGSACDPGPSCRAFGQKCVWRTELGEHRQAWLSCAVLIKA